MKRCSHPDMIYFAAERLVAVIDLLVLRILRGIIIMSAC